MGNADFLRLGDWNAQCFQCGRKDKASRMVKNWQGYYVHPEHNEPRQVQDFVRGVPDNQIAPWTQPWPADVFTYVNSVVGYGDGVTTTFQVGSGLYPVTISSVSVAGVVSSFTSTTTGLITLPTPPAAMSPITVTAAEKVP